MRRYGLKRPISTLVRAIKANNKNKYVNGLILENKNIEKEQRPTYYLQSVDFNEQTRKTKLFFLESKQYRTIERYVTRNYVKYPIYSDWKTKSKTINKILKLTNEELENLNNNPELLIRNFAFDIVYKIGKEHLYPSWFILELIQREKLETINEIKSDFEKYEKEQKASISIIKNIITSKNKTLCVLTREKNKHNLKLNKAQAKLEVAKIKPTIRKIILTFFFILIFKSKKHIERLNNKVNKFKTSVTNLECKISNIQNEIKKQETKLKDIASEIRKEQTKKDSQIISITIEYENYKKDVKTLPITHDEIEDFIPLKIFVGMPYLKIKGCYIIHNKEFDKYYVGQSKDVYKRIRHGHFNGTNVKNIIFAEDYYASSYENKDDIFEVKIIELKTKDELDSKEAELIEKYDSFNSGYNGTSGNN